MVTGGQYGSNEGCQPYAIAKCSHHEPGPYPNCTEGGKTPKCSKSCISGYPKSYKDDKHYGATAYSVRSEQIQTEIMTNGPVEAAFSVYADFPTYRTGLCCKHLSDHMWLDCVCERGEGGRKRERERERKRKGEREGERERLCMSCVCVCVCVCLCVCHFN